MIAYVILAGLTGLIGFYAHRQSTKRRPRRVIVFSRYPKPGTTKTRLIPKLGPFGAALAQRHMTEKTLTTANGLRDAAADVELRYCGETKRIVQKWTRCVGVDRAICREQSEGDLGTKMAHAFRDAFDEGAEWVVLVGSDIPGISPDVVGEAFERLSSGREPMVLGPALDGGYYLVGLSKEASNHANDLFCGGDIEWGSSTVFSRQWKRAEEVGVVVGKLSRVLSDVDLPEDVPVFERDVRIPSTHLVSPSWSIVIPVLNESRRIESTLRNCIENADCSNRLEIVVVDGGSTDSTIEIVEKFVAATGNVPVKIVRSEAGRGKQLHMGVMNSSNENLLFLHADTQLPRGYDAIAFATLATPGTKLGAFRFDLDALGERNEKIGWWVRLRLEMVRWGTRVRSERFLRPYGDQGYFMRRKDYDDFGGFKPIPLMEDYDFLQRVRSVAAKECVKIADGPGVTTSARRWLNRGYIRTTGFNTFLLVAYHCGLSPETLAKWYYGK